MVRLWRQVVYKSYKYSPVGHTQDGVRYEMMAQDQ